MNLISRWGALREDKSDKINYTLIPTKMLARVAKHYTDWGKVHWDYNWLRWDNEFMQMCKESAFRHFIQWVEWQEDEDHLAACVFNMFSYDILKDKLNGNLDNYMKSKLEDMIDL